ncbi:MAG TPA: hypothetical protein VFL27_09295 [Candidatus Dormibacteraeota bacterium]|nr:hypothetical protein [Candidatus Dormibacteraeota bacterium]
MTAGGALALKLVLTPVLVGAASLAGRRWGSAVSGWLIGIPFTSGPIAFFLALDPGPRFAAAAALGTMAGAASQAAFCLGYAWSAQRLGWVASVGVAALAFAGSTVVLDAVRLPAEGYFVVVILVLVVALFLMPAAPPRPGAAIDFPAWDLPARMVVATAFVVVLTATAPLLGAHLAGLIAPFPLYATVLAAFAHRLQGPAQAAAVVHGLLLGLFAFASFFLVLSLLLPDGIGLAFVAAVAVAAGVQGASLFAGRRLGLA